MDTNEYIREHYLENTDQQLADLLGISPKAVRERRMRMGLSKSDTPRSLGDFSSTSKTETGVTILERLLAENGISLNEVGSIRLSSYQQGQKNAEGESEVLNLGGAAVTLKVDSKLQDGPEWPVTQPAAPVTIKPININKVNRKLKRAVIWPDPQIGFRRDVRTGELDPFHDRQAIEVALQITRDLNPDGLMNLGDFLDFPMFGRFAQEPGFQMTTQPTLDEAHSLLAEQKAVAPNLEWHVLMEGNHDLRLQNFILQNAAAAFGIQRANLPESWPVMSVQYLLRLEELGIEYVDGYPAGEYYINDRLKCEHGSKVGPRGKIANKIATDERVSVITGHNHRIETVYKTTPVKGGARVNLGMTLGCLCRIDGAVPSQKSGMDAHGRVIKTSLDWQQAIGVVEYEEGDGPFSVTPVLIHEGTAIYNGKLYQA